MSKKGIQNITKLSRRKVITAGASLGAVALTPKITFANRSSGPDALLQVVEDRCEGSFKNIREIISQNELEAHSEKYKSVAGLNIEKLNNSDNILCSLI